MVTIPMLRIVREAGCRLRHNRLDNNAEKILMLQMTGILTMPTSSSGLLPYRLLAKALSGFTSIKWVMFLSEDTIGKIEHRPILIVRRF